MTRCRKANLIWTVVLNSIKAIVEYHCVSSKDLRMVKPSFKSVPLQFDFEIAGLASAKKWPEIQNIVKEKCF